MNKKIEELSFNIVEIFDSIQGEGLRQGQATTFIRFYGCNLSCDFCDEPLHKDESKIQKMSFTDILSKIPSTENNTVICLTGGEPLIQPDIGILINELIDEGYCVQVETNGTVEPPNVLFPECIHWTVAPKELSELFKKDVFIRHLEIADEIKLVTATTHLGRAMYLTVQYILERECDGRHVPIFFQPKNFLDELNYDAVEACVQLTKEFPGTHLSLQLHKIVGVK